MLTRRLTESEHSDRKTRWMAISHRLHVMVNDEDVRYLGSLETEISDGDTVSILPAVAGGRW